MTLSVRFAVTGLTVLLLAACGGSESSPANGGAGGSSGGAGSSAAGGSTGSGGTSVGAGGTMPGGAGGTGPGGIGQCVETTSAIAADMTSSLGFSANDVLAIVGGAHPSDLAWVASDLYATHTRALTQTPLTLTLGSQPSAVRFIDSQGGGCPGPGLGVACIVCMKRMEIDIDVTLVTGDGALNEKLSVTLKTTTFHFTVPAAPRDPQHRTRRRRAERSAQ
jgi:hypothetical protein